VADPVLLLATVAVHRAREAWTWVGELLEPGAVDRRGSRTLSPAALAAQGELLRTERAERITADRAGIRQAGASAAPLNVAAVDARDEALTLIVDQCWTAASALDGFAPTHGYAWRAAGAAGDRWGSATGWLVAALPHCGAGTVKEIRPGIELADLVLRRTARVTETRDPVHAPCPVCGLHLLRIVGSAPDQADAVVLCDNRACLCFGVECTCRIVDRATNRRHVWPAAEFLRLHTPSQVGWLLRRTDRQTRRRR
jgi:hypothetical protein